MRDLDLSTHGARVELAPNEVLEPNAAQSANGVLFDQKTGLWAGMAPGRNSPETSLLFPEGPTQASHQKLTRSPFHRAPSPANRNK